MTPPATFFQETYTSRMIMNEDTPTLRHVNKKYFHLIKVYFYLAFYHKIRYN